MSGQVGEEVAATAMRAGARDYVSKSKLARLLPAMERELRETEVRRARKHAEEALRESEDRYRDLVENSEDLLCTHDLDGRILYVENPAPARALGYQQSEMLRMNIRDVLASEIRTVFNNISPTLRRDGVARVLMTVQSKAGKRRVWEYHNTLRTESVSQPIVRGMAHDVTDRLRTERAIRKLAEDLEQRVRGKRRPISTRRLQELEAFLLLRLPRPACAAAPRRRLEPGAARALRRAARRREPALPRRHPGGDAAHGSAHPRPARPHSASELEDMG